MAVVFRFIEAGRPVHFFIRFDIFPNSGLTPVVHYAIFKQMFLCKLHD